MFGTVIGIVLAEKDSFLVFSGGVQTWKEAHFGIRCECCSTSAEHACSEQRWDNVHKANSKLKGPSFRKRIT